MSKVVNHYCPFCASPDVTVVPAGIVAGKPLYQAFCRFCGANGPARERDRAVDMWNSVSSRIKEFEDELDILQM